jgi:hypothetical protein
MRCHPWNKAEFPSDMQQLMLFPPTQEEILIARINEMEGKLDRQRKGQFAKIGALQKKYDELLADMEIIKRGLCRQNACEIVELAVL